MNLIYDAAIPPKVFIDTTVLCGAIRKDGVNRSILKAARSPLLFRPIISRVCLFEFVRNAAEGLGKNEKRVTYNKDEIDGFFTSFLSPIFDYYMELPVNSLIGRYSIETIIREHRPIGEVLTELSGCNDETAKKIASSKKLLDEPLHRFDQDDFHVWVTAIQEECDYILTTNNRRFPLEIGKIKRVHPSDFYEDLINPFP
ncbi:PIN domain-containing protein [Pseudalkalibacillus caeni]|uniref:PIN domain-containing protein n=1 Tax=Exobacillus caeni TaxID=2574798 RepID=A0A5R9EZ46_9BACL|nr:PIN domain-containing protein [Pseudalkalibacillus caeni]TLS36467.1 PIN domain-containing protein [Pseudalkalibacillus caeni]